MLLLHKTPEVPGLLAHIYSAQSITHALYDLGANPELLKPLREEIKPIVAADGWTKAAMGKMWKLDSFLKESQRFHGIGLSTSGVDRCGSFASLTLFR